MPKSFEYRNLFFFAIVRQFLLRACFRNSNFHCELFSDDSNIIHRKSHFFVTLEQVIVTSMEAYLHSSKMRKTLYFKLISSDRLFEHWIDDSFDGYYFGWRNACWGWRSHVGKVRSSFVFYEVEPRLVESIYNMIWIRQLHASSQPAIKPSSENLLSIEMNDVNNSGIKMYFSL